MKKRLIILDGMSQMPYADKAEYRRRARLCLDALCEECPALADNPPYIVFKRHAIGGLHNDRMNEIISPGQFDLRKSTYILGHEMRHAFQHAMGWFRIWRVEGNLWARSWTTEARQMVMMRNPVPVGREYVELPWEADAHEFGNGMCELFGERKLSFSWEVPEREKFDLT